MPTFRIGQWVVWDVVSQEDGIGTVVGLPFLGGSLPGAEPLHPKQKMLWHLTGEEHFIFTKWLRPYKDPLDSPNYSVGAGKTARALATAINHTLPYALEETTRDLERARMESEDNRARVINRELEVKECYNLFMARGIYSGQLFKKYELL